MDMEEAQELRNTEYKQLKRKLSEYRRFAFLWVHGRFWRFLFALGIGWKVSQGMCWLGIYNKFRDGRCMYCGERH